MFSRVHQLFNMKNKSGIVEEKDMGNTDLFKEKWFIALLIKMH